MPSSREGTCTLVVTVGPVLSVSSSGRSSRLPSLDKVPLEPAASGCSSRELRKSKLPFQPPRSSGQLLVFQGDNRVSQPQARELRSRMAVCAAVKYVVTHQFHQFGSERYRVQVMQQCIEPPTAINLRRQGSGNLLVAVDRNSDHVPAENHLTFDIPLKRELGSSPDSNAVDSGHQYES
jgi:hypothetical protein